jgi:predicted dehydrogenase
MHLAFEVYGSRGSILVDMERLNELALYLREDAKGRQGYRRILASPGHKDYAPFCPAPGHQLGFNDVKTIEVKEVVTSLLEGRRFYPGFREAWLIQRVVDAALLSGRERQWIRVEEIC